MKNLKTTALFILLLVVFFSCNNSSQKEEKKAGKSFVFDSRVEELLGKMTIEDKVGQMCQYVGLEHIKHAEKNLTKEELANNDAHGFYPDLHSSDVAKMIEKGIIGSFLHTLTAKEANYLQSLAMKSKLKIPLLIGIDAIHGNGLNKGATIYPTPIGMASSWDTALVRRLNIETAHEMRATGSHWAFTPNLDIARDARWGRVGETFGEDPFLVTEMGVASIRGLQQGNFTGWTRAPESSNSSPISPSPTRTAKAGIGNGVGRRNTWPSTRVNSALRTAPGATAFTGPSSVGSNSAR